MGLFDWLLGKKEIQNPPAQTGAAPIQMGDLYESTSSESEARVNAILPSVGSEDVSHILAPLLEDLPGPRSSQTVEKRDFLPEAKSDWVVEVQFKGDPHLNVKQVADVFGRELRSIHGGMTIYAYDPETERWTFLISRDGPRVVTRLQFAFDYYASWNRDEALARKLDYARRLNAIKNTSQVFGEAKVHAEVNPEQAAEKTQLYQRLHSELNQDACIVLCAPEDKLYDGRQIWDVMLCLGMKWGDMDLFHTFGDPDADNSFSVHTTSGPGYFIPEYITSNELHVETLVFSYSIPRTHDPVKTYQVMLRAVQYAQSRLGGDLMNAQAQPLDADQDTAAISGIVEKLREHGFEPGGNGTLRLF